MKVDNGKPKLRVVFDASAKTEHQPSLNETLHIGPKLQNDISTILLRFRAKAFVLTCDVRQMYRQILISPHHRQYQLIWWRFSPNDPLRVFQLNTVTYGVSSSPFLAIRTLLHLAHIEQERFPLAARALTESLYVDDIICGADSLEEASDIQKQLIEVLRLGGFELRKWSSNSPELLLDIPVNHRQVQDLPFDNDDNILRILGLQWRANADAFVFQVNPTNVSCTKRSILSQIARVYDPLGFICPLSFYAKVLIQRLWIAGSDWDDPAPEEISCQWKRFLEELPNISNLSIPRVITSPSQRDCQLHAFCDASSAGYATVIYLRITDDQDVTQVKFVMAKSKVAPVKSLSIPRLELCGAVLLSNLVEFVIHSFQNVMNITTIQAWSDSQVALSWIRSFPNRFKPFVSNRVAHIQERISPDRWRYVPSSHNPADLPSRGCLPEELLRATLWWAGPSWLSSPPDHWPAYSQPKVMDNDSTIILNASSEEKVVTLVHTSSPHVLEILLTRLSQLRKIQRTLAYCRRFDHNCRFSLDKHTGPLSDLELDESLTILVRYTQFNFFETEISLLKGGKACPKWLARLSPFLDDRGIIRVGGRLGHTTLDFPAKHPALLPKRSPLTYLIIRHIHESSCHAGVNATMYLAQQRFWILSARSIIRSTLNKCYRCFRTNPSSYQPPMANLPPSRVSASKPFSCVGVDYGGPFSIIYRRHRGAKSFKIYLCLFVCFSTKAIHIEIANDLSTEAFLGALRRFVARRGRCSQIHSDRGTNFIGAARVMNDYLHQASVGESIQWIFNPPGAPHFGGLWEAGIKSVKTHLNRVVGHQILTYEEFLTLVTQIESLLNSRPLTPISSDPKDLSVLSPGHFLTMEPLTSFPEPMITSTKLSLLSRWQLVQHLHQSFWSRWSKEYLHTLHQRAKWTNDGSPTPPTVGAVVLIKTEQCPPLQWHLGRITELHPGKDNIPRVATVMTSSGTITRPLVKLCPLPLVETCS
ncbi:hypothetical protein WA026_012415 [Henosepilachna vigintioctopunctata]|uniref:Integrase catalytic domain-containing protein n=1 Tax=Henosepilachna vigintioctopunctata TaxID=420089 RepID=A0AAW1UXT0_9CUCU